MATVLDDIGIVVNSDLARMENKTIPFPSSKSPSGLLL